VRFVYAGKFVRYCTYQVRFVRNFMSAIRVTDRDGKLSCLACILFKVDKGSFVIESTLVDFMISYTGDLIDFEKDRFTDMQVHVQSLIFVTLLTIRSYFC